MNKKNILCGIGFIVLALVLIITPIIIISNTPTEQIQTKCYDRYNSEIEGLTCNKEVYSNTFVEDLQVPLTLLVLVGMMFLLVGIVMLITGLLGEKE